MHVRRLWLFVVGLALLPAARSVACTHVTLQGDDGTVVVGRTMEWATFDLEPQLAVVPRGMSLSATPMPDGQAGAQWKAKYGFVGVELLGKPILADGVNEKGLAASLLYMPGFAEYPPYDPAQAARCIAPGDVGGWIVSQFATVAEVRAAIAKIRVAPVVEPVLGFPPPVHFIVTDPTRDAIVIEFVGGQLQIYDAPLGVLTNAPPYDWHITNLRNHVNLRAVAWPTVKVADIDLKPLGAGSGMIGLPGDFTPPSRFVRAVAFSQTARKTAGGFDTAREEFRILDNFDVPIEAVAGEKLPAGAKPLCCSGTQYTTAVDLKHRVLYYHTDTDRQVRRVDFGAIDFGGLGDRPLRQPLRTSEEHAIEDVTPGR